MALKSMKDLSDNPVCLDALREIGNIGSGNAASSVSLMLNKMINIQVPRINVMDYNTVAESFGGPETIMTGLLLNTVGDVNGMLMFLLQKEFVHMTLNTLLGTNFEDSSEIGEIEMSALKEIGNIMAASYINAMVTFTNLKIDITPPDICIDMIGSILSVPAIHYANISDHIIFIENQFGGSKNNDPSEAVGGSHILMMPDTPSLERLFGSLGIEVE